MKTPFGNFEFAGTEWVSEYVFPSMSLLDCVGLPNLNHYAVCPSGPGPNLHLEIAFTSSRNLAGKVVFSKRFADPIEL